MGRIFYIGVYMNIYLILLYIILINKYLWIMGYRKDIIKNIMYCVL